MHVSPRARLAAVVGVFLTEGLQTFRGLFRAMSAGSGRES